MMNAWSGNANFGGGPPAQNSTTVYDWVHFTPYGETPPPPPPSAGTVSINNVSISEGDSGTNVETFTVTRSGGTAAFDVNFATSVGSATTADSDYVAKSGTLHFTAGQNTATIPVTINGDTKVEANETFNVNLSTATNGATISDGLGVGTITNDDVTTLHRRLPLRSTALRATIFWSAPQATTPLAGVPAMTASMVVAARTS